MALEKILYTAHCKASGGRTGTGSSTDGKLSVKLATPVEIGGTGEGTNPEQLFGVGYAACFIGAMNAVCTRMKISLPADTSIDSEVALGTIETGFGIQVKLTIHLPGMPRLTAQEVVDAAHVVCPYSNATRGNIDVTLEVAP
jgi:lipoyl-dependent peroxiredoxin